MVEKRFEIVDMILQTVVIAGRLVGQPAAKVVDGDHPVAMSESGHHMAEVIGPGRVAVHQDNARPFTLIKVVQAMVADGEEAAFVGIVVIHRILCQGEKLRKTGELSGRTENHEQPQPFPPGQ